MRARLFAIRTAVSALLLSLAFQGCQRSSYYSAQSALDPSSSAQLASGGGDGVPFDGRTARYLRIDLQHPCADTGADGKPLPNQEIVISGPAGNPSALLVRDGCAFLTPPQALRMSDLQFATDGSGSITYQGNVLTKAPGAQYLPNSWGAGGSGATLPTGWFVKTLGTTVATQVQYEPQFGANSVQVQVTGTQSNGYFHVFVQPWFQQASTSADLWTTSVSVKMVGGTMVTSNLNVGFHCFDSSNNYLTELSTVFSNPNPPPMTYQRFTSTANGCPGVATIAMRISGNTFSAGESYTIQFVAPQLERGPLATPFIPTLP